MDISSSLSQLLLRSSLRADLFAGRRVFAGWLQSADWKTARALAKHHTLVVIDCEHGAIDLNDVALCVEVMAGNGCLSIVRVPYDGDTRKAFARRCLDSGAIGILFPNIRSPEEAREAVVNCYYPSQAFPTGKRGFGFGGCNEDGASFQDYARVANERVVIGVQLENRAAFEPSVLHEILACPGLVFTQDGPFDHSGSYLVPGDTSDPRVVQDLALYREACLKSGIAAGKHVVLSTATNITEAVEHGYRFIAMGTDMQHVMAGAAASMQVARAAQQDVRDSH